mmetsp:Transcript_8161/g.9258  ORF Transcript_8161/g.9258 Transcript_8161/m.9258 type:complete len:85 (+) Transcript_8161:418-672(+)
MRSSKGRRSTRSLWRSTTKLSGLSPCWKSTSRENEINKAIAKKEYRPFDREKDMQGVNSKEAFKAMYNSNDLSSRFDNSNSKFY